jgi:hypothetical protein
MRTLGRSRIFGLVAALAGLGSCNGILGIDEATLDPTETGRGGGGTSTGGTGGTGNAANTQQPVTDPPVSGCIEPKPACTSCFSSCPTFDQQRCLMNPTCRKALDGYRTCLGDLCTGGERCREDLSGSSDPDVQELVACLSSDACAEPCETSTLIGMCELYCACMVDNCSAKYANVSACLSACQTLNNPDLTYCRKMHCEFLEYPNTNVAEHCEHAMGIGQCESPIVVPPGDCKKAYPGFPCQFDADCCVPPCNGEVCG